MENTLWKELSIIASNQMIDLLSEFLSEEVTEGITIYNKPESEEKELKAYFSDEIPDDFIKTLNEQISTYKNSGVHAGDLKIEINEIKTEDWANDWKKYFEVFRVGKNLVVKPMWQEYSANENDVVINFDPGGFFGSTPHPSTRLCLEEIEDIASNIQDKENYNILDLGSGSGILSQALYMLGFHKITAIDIDPVAIRASEDNFVLNNMDVKLFLGDLKDCHDTYDIIAGNLLAEIVEQLAGEISEKLNKNGIFIGAGITRNQEESVCQKLEEVGISVIKKRYDNEWVLIHAVKG